MAEMKGKKIYKDTAAEASKVEEASATYNKPGQLNAAKVLTYNDLKKIASKIDFTQKEWSDILHISERTLQRYSKENTAFNFSVADRLRQIIKVLERGNEVFGSYSKFNTWLRNNPNGLEGQLSLHSLASFDGITNVLTQLGRIEHGILA